MEKNLQEILKEKADQLAVEFGFECGASFCVKSSGRNYFAIWIDNAIGTGLDIEHAESLARRLHSEEISPKSPVL